MEEFDYIIVGSGSSGSVITNRLSEINNIKICVLEAGGNQPASIYKNASWFYQNYK